MVNHWWQRSSPEQLQPLPWLAPDVITYLESLLTPAMRVIEHGSGGSTLWFAARVKSITSIEASAGWRPIITERAPANARIINGSSPGDAPRGGRKYDLLLIDGEPLEVRADWLNEAAKLIKPGGWVVLDNANRPEYARERALFAERAELVCRFDGNVPGSLYLVTEFYKRKV
jgi:predicted O-methyltransferase YrrM